jgi:hypothetical protein
MKDSVLSSDESQGYQMLGGPRDLDHHHLSGKKSPDSFLLDTKNHENDQEKTLEVSDFIHHIMRRMSNIRQKYSVEKPLELESEKMLGTYIEYLLLNTQD